MNRQGKKRLKKQEVERGEYFFPKSIDFKTQQKSFITEMTSMY